MIDLSEVEQQNLQNYKSAQVSVNLCYDKEGEEVETLTIKGLIELLTWFAFTQENTKKGFETPLVTRNKDTGLVDSYDGPNITFIDYDVSLDDIVFIDNPLEYPEEHNLTTCLEF